MSLLRYRPSPDSPWTVVKNKISVYASQIMTRSGKSVQSALDQHQTLLDAVYPIGTIYISTVNVSPAGIWGGTWERIKDCFLLSAGDSYTAGDTGGEATHTHGLSNVVADIVVSNDGAIFQRQVSSIWRANQRRRDLGSRENLDTEINGGAQVSGTPDYSSNMPPYLAVYMWKRTA